MKKLIAMILALTSVMGILTACGDEKPESSENSVSDVSESISETSDELSESESRTEAEETTETEMTAATEKTETTAVKIEKSTTIKVNESEIKDNSETDTTESETIGTETEIENADEYIESVTNLIEAMDNSDARKLIELSYPKNSFEAMNKAGMLESMVEQISNNAELSFEEWENYNDVDIEVVSVRKAEPDEIERAAMQYSSIEGLCNVMIDAGITYDMLLSGNLPDTFTDEELLELAGNITLYTEENDNIEITVDFDSYDYVTFSFDGETVEIPVFKASGDIFKADLMMIGKSVKERE